MAISKDFREPLFCDSKIVPFSHAVFQIWKKEVVMKDVNAFDVGKHDRDDLVRKHVNFAIFYDDVKMKNLNRHVNINANFQNKILPCGILKC